MPRIWISIGSNIDAEANIHGALKVLKRAFGDAVLSPVYETTAVGFEGPPFLNLVAGFVTDEPPENVMRVLNETEAEFGRIRGEGKFDSRTIDLDLLTYGAETLTVNGKHLPRDEILKYAFVLRPLADAAPEDRHPADGRTYGDLWAAFGGDRSGMSLIAYRFD